MALPCYLAMTAAEIRQYSVLPPELAWMACHFSFCDAGLSNLPAALPENAVVVLDDAVPYSGHDPRRIVDQLLEIATPAGILLDFQRPGDAGTEDVVRAVVSGLSCPVGVSECYAARLRCPVFLPPLPLGTPLEPYLQPWKGRPVWLEAALDSAVITVTADGCRYDSTESVPDAARFADRQLHCHYQTEVTADAIRFRLTRTPEDLAALLAEAEALGVERALGLYQELGFCFGSLRSRQELPAQGIRSRINSQSQPLPLLGGA